MIPPPARNCCGRRLQDPYEEKTNADDNGQERLGQRWYHEVPCHLCQPDKSKGFQWHELCGESMQPGRTEKRKIFVVANRDDSLQNQNS